MPMSETDYLLTCLSEEAAEIAERTSKALRFGLSEIQPGQKLRNSERIVSEIVDLLAVLELLESKFILKMPPDTDGMKSAKKDKLRSYMDYSARVGRLK